MDAKGIILELQWKKKYAVKNGGDDVSNIGVCYMAEPSADLDWMSFKSYLCQNVGTKEDVTFAYVDSEGDEIPIESECEFQEALKFARHRARRGRAIVLKLDRPHGSDTSNPSANMERSPLGAPAKTAKNQKNGTVFQCEVKKDVKPPVHPSGKTFVPVGKAKNIIEGAGGSAQRKKSKVAHSEGTRDDSSPAWFEKEKEKMKNEIVDQITSEMAREMQKYAEDMEATLRLLDGLCLMNNVDGKKKKRKKVSDKVLLDIHPRDRRLAIEGKGIVMEFEWKKKYEVTNRGGDPPTIGVCFMPDPSPHLEWKSFKAFLSKTLGIKEESTLAYEDREGNEIPIESECDFEKALKFARQRSHEGGSMLFKLDRSPDYVPPSTDFIYSGTIPVDVSGKTTKLGIKNEMQKNEKPFHPNPSMEKSRSTATVQQTKTKMVHSEDTRDDSPPVWFEKEKDKMKNEIVSEVTSQIKREFQQAVAEMKKTLQGSDKTHPVGTVETTSAKRMKKKVSDEESSDANAVEQREHKLLRKIEKLQKREKKLEKKLDSKLEKLENRTKRMLEKKSHSKSRSEPVHEQSISNRKRTDVPVGTYLMDAILLNGGSKLDTHIKLGESFTKIWQIMNTGTLPWTDKTELRLAWGTTGLEPQVTTVKCPALEPGERGQICVTFKAPEFAGTFESYWHFYHMGVRFGHWISCAVIVEPKEETEAAFNDCDVLSAKDNHSEDFDTKSRNDHAVDLTVRSKSEDSDLEVITNFEKDHENCRDAEYESDSDSDNLSVISNELSMSSESDEDKFVVVTLPPSSTTEGKSLGSGDANIDEHTYPELITGTMTAAAAVSDDTVTSTITTDKSSSAAMLESNVHTATCLTPTTTNIESAQGRDNNEASVEVKPSTGASDEKVNDLTRGPEAASETDFIKSQLEEEEQSFSQNAAPDQPLFDLTHSMKNNGNVNNIVFAVDILGRTVPVKLTNKPKKQNSNTSSPPSSGSYPDVCPVSVENSEEIQPNPNIISSDHGNDLRSENASNYSENSPNIIHILPETLMNGAVNVATSAISTARAVISNLRTIPSRTTNTSGWEAGSPADSSHPSVTSQSMAVLLDMGFTNKELNLTLLKRNNNDISKVVSELLSHAEDNSTTI